MECISGSERHSCQPRLLYPGKLSYGEIYNRETKTLLDKRRLMEFMTTKPVFRGYWERNFSLCGMMHTLKRKQEGK